VKLASFSELWFNDGGPTNQFNVTEAPVVFDAKKISELNVGATWNTSIDTAVNKYELQRGNGVDSFHTIFTQAATHQLMANYNYTDTPSIDVGSTLYYRIKYTLKSNKVYYTYLRQVDWTAADQLIAIFPNPVENGQLTIKWSANSGTDLKILVTDVTGRMIKRNEFAASEWNNTTIINLTGIAAGIYVVKVSIGSNHYVEKVLVK
jgi:Secretion system C-terminal sorting domain